MAALFELVGASLQSLGRGMIPLHPQWSETLRRADAWS